MFTKILIVTLPEATPVHEAERLQNDLRRAGITSICVGDQSEFPGAGTRDPVLAERAALEMRYIDEVQHQIVGANGVDRLAISNLAWKHIRIGRTSRSSVRRCLNE